MSTFFSDVTNDFQLDSDKRLVFETDPVVSAAISLKNKFQLFLGEWFINTEIGIPYFQQVLVKDPDVGIVRRLFDRVLRSEPLVSSTEISLSYDPSERTLQFAFVARMQDGRTITGGSGQPFIVSGIEEE